MSSGLEPFVPVGRVAWDEQPFKPKGEVVWDNPNPSPEQTFDMAVDQSETDMTEEEKDFLVQQEGEEGEVLTATGDRTSEGRPIYKNQWGDLVTERTITEYIPSLGGVYNIPTVMDGRFLGVDEAIQLVVDSDGKDPITGRQLTKFSTIEDAVESAKRRSKDVLGKELSKAQQDPIKDIEGLSKLKEGLGEQSYIDSVGLDLLRTIAMHETKGEEDPWIRTRFQPKEGSTAFGPAQITGKSLKDLRGKTSRPETLELLIAQADKFAELGGGDWKKKGLSEQEAQDFEYGGKGFGLTEEQKEDYWVIAEELLSRKASILGLSPNPMDWTEDEKRKVVGAWHGGGEDISKEEYVDKVLGALDEK